MAKQKMFTKAEVEAWAAQTSRAVQKLEETTEPTNDSVRRIHVGGWGRFLFDVVEPAMLDYRIAEAMVEGFKNDEFGG